jgi:hypothetical protein
MPNGLRAWQGPAPGGSSPVRHKRIDLFPARHRPQKKAGAVGAPADAFDPWCPYPGRALTPSS